MKGLYACVVGKCVLPAWRDPVRLVGGWTWSLGGGHVDQLQTYALHLAVSASFSESSDETRR
jgi:hypothetical protein